VQLLDSRRLTGQNLHGDAPGAIAEVAFAADEDRALIIAAWREALGHMLAALDVEWGPVVAHARATARGASLYLAAPVDLLLPATEINEWALEAAVHMVSSHAAAVLEPARTTLAASLAEAARPALRALDLAARQKGFPCLIDDEQVTLGTGKRLVSYPADGVLPAPAEVPWALLGRMPTALVTGTNGKTTTTRLAARMVRCAGLTPGVASSDGVAVDERWVTRGDWSGPDAARLVLRHPDVDVAILETARGGILRRGLATGDVDVAVITNVSADHLGHYGIDDVPTMARVKAVTLRHARTCVLNADDPHLPQVAAQAAPRAELVWFSTTRRPRGANVWYVDGGTIVHALGSDVRPVLPVDQAPFTFGGEATYNVANALAACALAAALGLPHEAIVRGLASFGAQALDNPGRGHLVDKGGVRWLVDFGHNPAAVHGVLALAHKLRAGGRLLVTIGMPGDRPDDELDAVAREIAAVRPERVVVRELTEHLRGREPGQVPAILARTLAATGVTVDRAEDELAAVQAMAAAARPGDLCLVLTHTEARVDTWLSGAPPSERTTRPTSTQSG
jgi:cyanophycin synthetase